MKKSQLSIIFLLVTTLIFFSLNDAKAQEKKANGLLPFQTINLKEKVSSSKDSTDEIFWVAFSKDQQQKVSKTHIGELIKQGKIKKDTLIWKSGWKEWKKIGEVATFKPLFQGAKNNEVPPPIPSVQKENHTNVTPPPLSTSKDKYWVALNSERKGPYDLSSIKKMIKEGKIDRNTLIWKKGTTKWVRAQELLELKDSFLTKPPKVPLKDVLKGILVGSWHGSFNASLNGINNRVEIEVTYFEDGSLSAVQTYYPMDSETEIIGISPPPVTISIKGKWTLKPINKKRFQLIEKVSGFAPGMSMKDTISSRWEVVDQDTIRNLDKGYELKRVK